VIEGEFSKLEVLAQSPYQNIIIIISSSSSGSGIIET
jgi:hypothetical protein